MKVSGSTTERSKVGDIEVARTSYGPFERLEMWVPTPSGPSHLSTYRVGDALIDGGGSMAAPALIDMLRNDPPRRILCTHQHEDHVGGIEAVRQALGPLPVHIERRYIPHVEGFDRIPHFRAIYFGHPRPVKDAIGFEVGSARFELEHEGKAVTLETVETPGHTPYHVTYLAHWEGRVYALTGDLYTQREPNPAWHETSVPCLVRSCRRLAEYGDALFMLPTHGKVRPDGAAVLSELADWAEREAEKVHAAAARVGSDDHTEIGREAFGDGDAQLRVVTEGQYCHANFVRSVLDPVLEL